MDQFLFDLICVNKFDSNHQKILFQILNSRKFNISHAEEVDYQDHVNFVLNNKYKYWYIIYLKNEIQGSVYITEDNFIGISLIKDDKNLYKSIILKILQSHQPNPGIKSFRSKFFCINVSPNNLNLQVAADELGLKKIQFTYSCN